MLKKILFIIMMTSVLFISKAWDAIEIEARGYVLGVAIDEYPPMPDGEVDPTGVGDSGEDNRKLGTTKTDLKPPNYALTVQFPIIKKATTSMSSSGGSGGGVEGSKTWQITQTGSSFAKMNEEITSRTNLLPYYEHLQVIVISDAVARKGLNDVLDFFVRDPEMRRRVFVFITKGEAKKVLDVVPRIEDYSSIYLSKLPLSSKVNSMILDKVDLGEMLTCLHSGEDFALPVVKATKDEIKIDGCAIFVKDKLKAFGNETDSEIIKLIKNKTIGGVYAALGPISGNAAVSLKIIRAKSKVTPVPVGSGCGFDIDIKIDGNLEGFTSQDTQGKLSKDLIREIEEKISRHEERLCREVIEKAQKEYGADVFSLDRILRAKLPDYWNTIKDQWHTVFPNVKVNVHVTTEIRQIGNVR